MVANLLRTQGRMDNLREKLVEIHTSEATEFLEYISITACFHHISSFKKQLSVSETIF